MKSLHAALLLPSLCLSFSAFAQEQTREVDDFQGVSVSSGIKARVSVGPKSVRISGDEDAVARVRTTVDDGNLVVTMAKGRGGGVLLTLSSPSVTHLEASSGASVEAHLAATPTFTIEASGGGEVSVDGLDSAKVEVEASGGAEVTLKGRADVLQVEASGGSEVHGQALRLKALEAEASGGTRVKANPTDRVEAEASGGSSIHVETQPSQRHVSTSGGSKVVFPRP
ncbi:head GIN domain-containing protein [Stigmatella aurantiaca]|uniref:Conserved uncharacterized protein n=1 Tax=Stigmatella aurantiaca (strain DW4/3-1) TaxID=378806 RepID=Q09D26_STIAD|nr:head GIN domain-containing protein [Stigmatella aurantiaca]ADO67887.1 conserved uncharacterized protein [Stigmatella aurantiaca DW4/3-1]EAU69604.1 hypothetical protein STIAU_2931 [Stigmatella aurantiaca DW4/3-1]